MSTDAGCGGQVEGDRARPPSPAGLTPLPGAPAAVPGDPPPLRRVPALPEAPSRACAAPRAAGAGERGGVGMEGEVSEAPCARPGRGFAPGSLVSGRPRMRTVKCAGGSGRYSVQAKDGKGAAMPGLLRPP